MSMKKIVKCHNHEGYFLKLHPEFIKFPQLCPWCMGNLEYEIDVRLHYYEGEFHDINWEDISDISDDFYFGFECICGDKISLTEGGDTKACSCGRVYRLSVDVLVDETHIGDNEFLIEESNKRE